jgi:hypothetical protein
MPTFPLADNFKSRFHWLFMLWRWKIVERKLLANSMEHSFRVGASSSANQGIPSILCNPKFYFPFRKCPPLVAILVHPFSFDMRLGLPSSLSLKIFLPKCRTWCSNQSYTECPSDSSVSSAAVCLCSFQLLLITRTRIIWAYITVEKESFQFFPATWWPQWNVCNCANLLRKIWQLIIV